MGIDLWWINRQFQHLKKGTVKGDQIFFNQPISGLDILIKAEF
jgi:hypothetical protein